MGSTHPLATLLLQIIVVVGAARLLGVLFQKAGQPAVIGEMLAGILLGPSLLGAWAPVQMQWIFPAQSLPMLQLLSQLGVVLFMFFVGMELDLQQLRQRAKTALVVSQASIWLPLGLGAVLSFVLYDQLAVAGTRPVIFMLFMAVALSVTAFPVLARIVRERGLMHTQLGITAIACAAVADVAAWSLLAVVIALVQADGFGAALRTIALATVFTVVMLRIVRPRIATWLDREVATGHSERSIIVAVLLLACAAAFCSEWIGIHALFGAFLAGAIMPAQARISRLLHERVETFVSAFLLPLFFAYAGLRTDIGLLNTANSWLLCLAIIAVAVIGKWGGTALAARWTGLGWRDASALGALMNTRGLMELVVLNVGYDLGILSPQVFAMMVIMALVTTAMTGPALNWIERRSGVLLKNC